MNNNYKEYLKSNEWKEIKSLVLKRDGNKCIKCGNTNNLQVHHTTYSNIFNEAENLNDLITLCGKCHMEEHNITKVDEDLKLNNNYIPLTSNLNCREFLFWILILKMIQDDNDKCGEMYINRSDLLMCFDRRFITKNNIRKTMNNILINQSFKTCNFKNEDIVLIKSFNECDNGLIVKYDIDIYNKLCYTKSGYSTINIKDIASMLKSSTCINVYMLLSKFKNTKFLKIKNENIRFIMDRSLSVNQKYINRDLKSTFNTIIGKDNYTFNFDKEFDIVIIKYNTIGGVK